MPGSDLPFGEIIQPWQERDFALLDPAWQKLAGLDVETPLCRAWIERPRGHAKTSDMAMQIAWILRFANRPLTGVVAAADQDQAALIRDAFERLVQQNAWMFEPLILLKHRIENRDTKSRLTVISSDVNSSWGMLPDFVICDELCHWPKPDLWYSLLSSAAKRPHCVLAVLTNAGIGQGWQWTVRESARKDAQKESPMWAFSTLDGPQAPWITEKHLAEQRALLPMPVFERLWLNRWQHSDGEFVTLAEAEACREESLKLQTQGQPYRQYYAAIDYAEKRDLTVGVVLHREKVGEDSFRLVVDRMDVTAPKPDSPTPVSWVGDWIEEIAAKFQSVQFVLDEWQLLGVIQAWEKKVKIHRFEFAAGKGNHELALTLHRLIAQRQVAWYPQCGQRKDIPSRDDLETELASLLFRQSPSGRCRLDHRNDGDFHDDRSFALGAACWQALKQPLAKEWLAITPPAFDGSFAW
jgi:hypothetical protein